MIQVRRANDRGHAQLGWLDSRHTFSFGRYYDPAHMGFRKLRVLNEDHVEPGQGFGTHGHDNMEIMSYVVGGTLTHRDSMGSESQLRPGDVQIMSAGTGITHSEFNGSDNDPLHFLQIWIEPAAQGTTPRYDERHFSREDRRDQLTLLVSPDGADDSLVVGQDVRVYGSVLSPATELSLPVSDGRAVWVQVVNGEVTMGSEELAAGDGASVAGESAVLIKSSAEAEILVFDLP